MSKSGLDKLIEQVLAEKNIEFVDFAAAMHVKPPNKDHSLARILTGIVDPQRKGDFFGYFKNVAGEKQDFAEIASNDINFLINNPQTIDTKDEYVLKVLVQLDNNYAQVKKFLEDYVASKALASAGEVINTRNAIENFLKVSEADIENLATLAEKALVANEKELDKAEKRTDPETISAPKLNTQEIEAGKLPKEYEEALAAIVGARTSQTPIQQEIKLINDVSKKYYDAYNGNNAVLANQPITKTLSEIMILDLFNLVYKQVDSGSGAYYFEALLAFIAGGKVLGKLKTDAGKMGAADFSDGAGGYGSAKFYGKPSGITQASEGFKDLYRKYLHDGGTPPLKVTYAVGIKKEDTTQFGGTAAVPDTIDPYASSPLRTTTGKPKMQGTSDPARIMASEIFMPVVEYTEVGHPDGQFKIDGVVVHVPKNSKIVLDNHLGSPISPPLYITSMRTESFREFIAGAIKNEKNELKDAIEYFKKYFDALSTAEKSAKIYSSTGKPQDAQKTKTDLKDANTNFESLQVEINKDRTARGITESKSSLDQLIESIIKKKLLK